MCRHGNGHGPVLRKTAKLHYLFEKSEGLEHRSPMLQHTASAVLVKSAFCESAMKLA